MSRAHRFPQVTIIVLMATGEQQYTKLPIGTLVGIGKAFRSALEQGPVQGAMIVSSEGFQKYTAGEVTELAEHRNYR